jgi:hypothetical protein
VAAAIISALPNSLAMLKMILANSTEESLPVEIKAQVLGDEQRQIHKYFLREKIENEELSLEYLPTNEQPTNLLTKGLCHNKHETFMKKLGLHATTHNMG